ncbi:MAG: heme-binding protein [Clostridia bacterium]|nr:heme-binding protein [Clostridia bacterium]
MDDKTLNDLVDAVTKSVLSVSKTSKTDYSKGYITLDTARKLVRRVEKEAEKIGVKAVVAVSNAAARPVIIECMDDSYIASYDVALNKAYTSVALKMPTSTLKTLTNPGDELYGIQFTNQGQIVIFGGGVPLIYNGEIIGGLGVSGGSEKQDTYLAKFGAEVFEEELS